MITVKISPILKVTIILYKKNINQFEGMDETKVLEVIHKLLENSANPVSQWKHLGQALMPTFQDFNEEAIIEKVLKILSNSPN